MGNKLAAVLVVLVCVWCMFLLFRIMPIFFFFPNSTMVKQAVHLAILTDSHVPYHAMIAASQI